MNIENMVDGIISARRELDITKLETIEKLCKLLHNARKFLSENTLKNTDEGSLSDLRYLVQLECNDFYFWMCTEDGETKNPEEIEKFIELTKNFDPDDDESLKAVINQWKRLKTLFPSAIECPLGWFDVTAALEKHFETETGFSIDEIQHEIECM